MSRSAASKRLFRPTREIYNANDPCGLSAQHQQARLWAYQSTISATLVRKKLLSLSIRGGYAKTPNLHQVFVTRLGPPGAVLGENVGMGIELHSDELDDARRCEGNIRKRTMKKAEQEQIKCETEPIGCPAASPYLKHILGRDPEEPTQLFGGPLTS
jgi:hypothetical protein